MLIFEVKEPYYAMIAAKNEEECMKLYTEVVSDIDSEEDFLDELAQVTVDYAIAKTADVFNEDTQELLGMEEATKSVNNDLGSNEPSLMLVDASIC